MLCVSYNRLNGKNKSLTEMKSVGVMETIIEKVDPRQIDEHIMEQAGQLIAEGELVAFPTETVYGLGGDALHPEAAKKIYAAKGRPSDNPLIVHIAEFSDMERVAKTIPEQAKKLADAFWPGPLTFVLPRKDENPALDLVCAGLKTITVRCPPQPEEWTRWQCVCRIIR